MVNLCSCADCAVFALCRICAPYALCPVCAVCAVLEVCSMFAYYKCVTVKAAGNTAKWAEKGAVHYGQREA